MRVTSLVTMTHVVLKIVSVIHSCNHMCSICKTFSVFLAGLPPANNRTGVGVLVLECTLLCVCCAT